MLSAARCRAKVAGVPFSLTPDDIKIPKWCPVLGLRLQRQTRRPAHNSPSLDRIVPRLGYVRGNVLVVSHRANTLKGDATVTELRKLWRFYSKQTKGT